MFRNIFHVWCRKKKRRRKWRRRSRAMGVKKIGDKKYLHIVWAKREAIYPVWNGVFELFADPIPPSSLPHEHKFSASLKIASNWKRGCTTQLEAKKNERDGTSIAIVTRDDPFIRGPFAPTFSFQASYCSWNSNRVSLREHNGTDCVEYFPKGWNEGGKWGRREEKGFASFKTERAPLLSPPFLRTNPIFKDEILALIRDPNTRNRYRSGSRYLERFLSRKVSNAGQVCQTQSFEIFGYRWKTLPLSIPSTKVDWKGDRVETVHLEKKKSPNATVFFVVFYIDEQNHSHEIL